MSMHEELPQFKNVLISKVRQLLLQRYILRKKDIIRIQTLLQKFKRWS